MDDFWLALLGGGRFYHFRGKQGPLHNGLTLNARIAGYTEVTPKTAFEAAIEGNRRGTWTINALIVHLKS